MGKEEVKDQLAGLVDIVSTEKPDVVELELSDIEESRDNFYSMSGVEQLKQSIKMFGVMEPIIVARKSSGYRIISGHRRYTAVKQLSEEGNEQFNRLPAIVKDVQDDLMEKLALIMSNYFRDKTDWEKILEAVQTEELLQKLKEYKKVSGKVRDLAADILKTSTAQLAKYKAIHNNLSDDWKKELQENRIGISVAYEVSGIDKDQQKRLFDAYVKNNHSITLAEAKKVKEIVEGKAPNPSTGQYEEKAPAAVDDVEDPSEYVPASTFMDVPEELPEEEEDTAPEISRSKCYNCTEYETCPNVRQDVTECEDYHSRSAAKKTDEQRYSEKQARIDKKTQEKLEEMEDAAKMAAGPAKKEHDVIKLATTRYNEITGGLLTFYVVKKDGYHVGEDITMPEYADGEPTGNEVKARVMYVMEDWTGIEEDYCVLGLRVLEFGNTTE